MSKKDIKKAAAVSYKDAEEPGSAIRLSGRDAELFIKKALESGMPVREDKELMDRLTKFDILNTVPDSLYGVAAEILSYIHKIDSRFKGMTKGSQNA